MTSKLTEREIPEEEIWEGAYGYVSKRPSHDIYGHIAQDGFVAGAKWADLRNRKLSEEVHYPRWVKASERFPFLPGRYYVEYSDGRKDLCYFTANAWVNGPYTVSFWLEEAPNT